MPRCVLHVGHAKTATSYLQHCLHLNEVLLRQHGWWLPGNFLPLGYYDLEHLSRIGGVHSGNLAPMHLLLSEGPGDQVPAMLDYLFNAPEMPPDADVLLSSELFFYYPNAIAEVIRAARMRGYTPEVIAYVARQDRSAIPSYLQYVRNHGYSAGVIDFLLHDEHMQYCRYRRAMQKLTLAAPETKIRLRTFDRAYLAGGDVFTDFLGAIGCTVPEHLCTRPQAGNNEALLLEQYELLRAAALLNRPDAAERLRQSASVRSDDERARVQAYYYRPYVAAFLAQHFMRGNNDLLDRFMPEAGPAERAYWQQPDPAPPAVELDRTLLERLRDEAFG